MRRAPPVRRVLPALQERPLKVRRELPVRGRRELRERQGLVLRARPGWALPDLRELPELLVALVARLERRVLPALRDREEERPAQQARREPEVLKAPRGWVLRARLVRRELRGP